MKDGNCGDARSFMLLQIVYLLKHLDTGREMVADLGNILPQAANYKTALEVCMDKRCLW